MLSSVSSGRLTGGETTATIGNRNPLPRAPLARFGRTSGRRRARGGAVAGAAEAGLRGPFRRAGVAVDADQTATDQQDAVDLPLVGVAGIAARAVRARAWRKGPTTQALTLRVGRYRQTHRGVVGDAVLHVPASGEWRLAALTTQARDAAGATVPTGTRAEPYGGGRRTRPERGEREDGYGQTRSNGGNASQGGSTVASVAGFRDVAARCWLLRA